MSTPGTQPKNGDAVYRALHIVKYFGGIRALGGVSVEIRAGQVTCLVGDNGAGKSTLVKILSGNYEPDEGELWLDGEPVEGMTPQRARTLGIETVYQDLALCDNLSAAANVLLGREPIAFRVGPFRFTGKRKEAAEAAQLLESVGATLADLDSPIRRLSGGQRQAIAIARALSGGSRVILFDEPTAALGVRQTESTLNLIRAVADRGVGVVVISHSLDDVFKVADRIIALRLGTVVLDAQRDETTPGETLHAMAGLRA